MKEYQKYLTDMIETYNKKWTVDIETEDGDRLDVSCEGKNADEAIEDCLDQMIIRGIVVNKIFDVIEDVG